MSPFRSRAGPATVRIPTSSSSRMIVASVVFPSPGGPTSRTWSSASPRPFAASSAISSCSFVRSWPTKSSSRRGRSDCSTSSSPSRAPEPGTGCSRGAPERLAHALLDGQVGIDRRERLLGLDEGVTELDEGVARDELAGTPGSTTGAASAIEPSSSRTIRSAVFLPMPGNRLEARRVARARSRAGARPARRSRRRRAPPSGRCRSHRGAARRARARRRRRTRRAGARPRGRGDTSRPSPRSRRPRAGRRSASRSRGIRHRRRRRRARRPCAPPELPRSREIIVRHLEKRRAERVADRHGVRVCLVRRPRLARRARGSSFTMRCICPLSARPYPQTVCLTRAGACSAHSTPASAAATSTAPRACPTESAMRASAPT